MWPWCRPILVPRGDAGQRGWSAQEFNRIELGCRCKIKLFRIGRKTAQEIGAAFWWADRKGQESWQSPRVLGWRQLRNQFAPIGPLQFTQKLVKPQVKLNKFCRQSEISAKIKQIIDDGITANNAAVDSTKSGANLCILVG